MKKILLLTTAFQFLLTSISYELKASVNTYSFTQKQDTMGVITGGNVFYHNRGNAPVYYGAANITYGYFYPASYVFSGIPIGFNFEFNGQNQDVFGICSKGYLVLGSGSVNMLVNPVTQPISGNSQANIISALGGDVVATNGTLIRYKIWGTAPFRILAIQWENMARRYSSAVDSLTFQIRLHETTNKIEIIYSDLFIPKQGSDQFFEIGLKGILATDYSNRKLNGTWKNTIPGYSNASKCLLGKYNYPALATCFTYSPPNQACLPTSISGYARASNYSAGGNELITLALDSVTSGIGTSLEWQISADSNAWSAIVGATLNAISITQNSTSYYRCKISCNSSFGYSNTLSIIQLDSTQKYCSTSYSRYPDATNIGNVVFSNLNNGNALPAQSAQLFLAYSDFTYLPAANVSRGGNYQIKVSQIFKNSYIKSGIMVFIDFNHDGTFSGPEEELFLGKTKSNIDGYYQKSYIQIPDSALLGKTKLRIVMYDPNTQLPVGPCDASFNGETEDYLINVTAFTACTTMPDTVYTASSLPYICNNTPVKLFLSTPLSSGYTYQWLTSTDSISWTAIAGANKNSITLTQSQLSFYKCRISCQATDSIFSIPVGVRVAPFYECYCASKATNPSNFQIGNVRLSNLDNSSGSKIKLYTNYTLLPATKLVKGGRYTFAVTQKSISYTSGGARIKAFIDFDRDGVYGNNTNEIINIGFTTSSVFPNNTVSFLLNVPDSASAGITGMRIVLWDNNPLSYSYACGNFNHGEVEDYLVSISEPDACIFPLNAGYVVSQDSSVCVGQNVHLSLSGINYSPNIHYQWQTSIDSITWLVVPNANLFTLSLIQNTRIFYRCQVSCNGDSAYSLPITVAVTNFIHCYCVSYPLNPESTDIGNIQLAGYSYGKDTLAINAYGGNSYSDFTDSLAVIVLERGGLYPMKITAAKTAHSFPNSKAYVFIDFNANGVFESSENFNTGFFINSINPNSAALDIAVPIGAIIGYTRMRIILLNHYNLPLNQSPCSPYQYYYGETEDYLINVVPPLPCQTLLPGTIFSNFNSVCPGTKVSFNYLGSSYQSQLNYFWQKSIDSLNWVNIGATRIPFFIDSISVEGYYRCIARCQTEFDTSTIIKVVVKAPNQCYCISGFSNNSNVDIGNIKIAGYNYGVDTLLTNPFVDNNYQDYTNSLPAIILQKGGYYPLKIQAAKSQSVSYISIAASVYIDYNQNGIFELNEKTTPGSFSTSFPYLGSANVLVPINAPTGLTRMRIVLLGGGNVQIGPSACGILTNYGETEDYLVNIISPLPCLPMLANNFSVSSNTVCYGTNFTLISSSNQYQPLLNHIWQSSLDNVFWSNIDTTQTSNTTISMVGTKYFRSIVSCNVDADTSNSIQVALTPPSQCYCASSVAIAGNVDVGNIKLAGYNYGGDTLVNPNTNNTYSNYTSSLPAIILEQGGSYPMKVLAAKTISFSYTPNASVYIDFNQTGSFEANEKFFVGNFPSSFPYLGTTLINVPASALLGLTRMRVVINACGPYPYGPPACGTNSYYGETEDYMVNIISPLPCQSLQPGQLISSQNVVCPSTNLMMTYSGNSYQASLKYIWQSSLDSVNWISKDTTNIPNYAFQITNQNYFRCIAICLNERDTSQFIKINFQPFYNCYCSSSVSNAGNVDIGNIKIAGYSYGIDTLKFNPVTTNTYSDLTNLPPIQLEQGGNYPMDVIAAKSTVFNYVPNASVYIDFNHNGVFENSEAFYINNFPSVFPFLGTTLVNVPLTAQIGSTRMRVIINACGNYFPGPPACGTNSYYGETEDYLVNIIPILPCPILVHGSLYVQRKEICPTEKFKLKHIGNPYQALFSYNWQFSGDSITWVQLPGTIYSEYSNQLSTITYYRCIVTCNGVSDTSDVVKLSPNSFTNCYCTSTASDSGFVDIGNINIAGYSYGDDTLLVNQNAKNTYSDFTYSLAPIILEKGGHYPLNITYALSTDTKVNVSVNVYLDFNQNGYFETTESFSVPYFSSTFPYIGSRIIDIPVTAVLGLTRMRVVLSSGLNMNGTFDACSIYQYGETEDYTINIINALPCQPIDKGSIVSLKAKYCPNETLLLNYVGNAYHAQFTYIWQGSLNGLTWINYSYTNIPSYSGYFQPNSALKFRCIATCGSFKDTSLIFNVPVNEFYHCYCQSSFQSSLNQDIGNVTLSTLNNGNPLPFTNNQSSVCSYSNFTNLNPVNLTKGFIYPLSVSQINSAGFIRSKVKAYFDFNADGDYFDLGEEFLIGVTSDTIAQPGKVIANIVVPYDATIGLTGMRIVLNEKYTNNSVFPCATYYQNGETEDYLVNIVSNTNCTLPVAGSAVAPIDRYCVDDSVYLRLENNFPLNGQSYQWQSSVDSIVWVNVGTKTAFSSKLIRISSPLYFRCGVSCNNFISYSTSVYVDTLPTSVCNYACNNLGGSNCFWNDKITSVVLQGTSLNNSDTSCYKKNKSFYYVFPDKDNTTAIVGRGKSYNLAVTSSKNTNISVWVDYDNNKVFSISEWKNMTDSSVAGVPSIINLDIPINAHLGKTRMRIRSRYGKNINDVNDACTFFYSGETEDYIIDIDLASNISSNSVENIISIEPNPAKDKIVIAFTFESVQDVQLKLLNTKGQLVYVEEMKQFSGKYQKTIEVNNLAKGIYILQLKTADRVISKKVVIE